MQTETRNIINRPEAILSDIEVVPFSRNTNTETAIEALLDGDYVMITDIYSSGLLLLNELKKYLKRAYPKRTFQGQRDYRSAYHTLSNKIILDVSDNKLSVKNAPEIGWLKILYPELSNFALPFPKVQGLNSAWQWYKKGVYIPVLDKKIYPYYGTYFPTRFDHLELFEEYLNDYKGSKKTAFDIGIGSGILSFQMIKHGVDKVIGTDINPNAIVGLKRAIKKNKKYANIELVCGNLFAKNKTVADLIVFNPPWLPAKYETEGLDKSIYYDANLFTDFFKEAKNSLSPNGKIVLMFSNLAQITNHKDKNPIEEELANAGRFKKDLLLKKAVASASSKTRRDQHWRSEEAVELWVLSHL
jgi:16S rRNA G966 N2-methylase RsmD